MEAASCRPKADRPPGKVVVRLGWWVDLAATYSRGSYTSTTIGKAAFDGRVRDGIGSDHSFMATKKVTDCLCQKIEWLFIASSLETTYKFRSRELCTFRESKYCLMFVFFNLTSSEEEGAKESDQAARPISIGPLTNYFVYTPNLSTRWSSGGLSSCDMQYWSSGGLPA